MRTILRLLCCTLLGGLLACSAAQASDPATIGSVRNTEGDCSLVRGTATIPAEQGTLLQLNDILRTGKDSSLGVLLRDNTSLSLGENSEVTVDEFLFDPANGKLALLATFSKGTAAVLTGKIAQLDPGAAKFQTPLATIGIRGTRFAVKVDN